MTFALRRQTGMIVDNHHPDHRTGKQLSRISALNSMFKLGIFLASVRAVSHLQAVHPVLDSRMLRINRKVSSTSEVFGAWCSVQASLIFVRAAPIHFFFMQLHVLIV